MQSQVNMAICPECGTEHTMPLYWEDAGIEGWLVMIVCGNCEVSYEAIFTNDECEAYDQWLDECLVSLMSSYRLMVRVNMTPWVNKFIAALEVDAILPEDF